VRDNPLRELLGAITARDDAWTAVLGRLDELGRDDQTSVAGVQHDVGEYLEDTAALLDTLALAVEGGRVDWAEVLDAAHGYLGNPDDLVSDEQGVLGILDDAFVCRCLLRQAADAARQRQLTPPVQVDGLPAEQTVRQLLGVPVAATLEVAARQTVADLVQGWR
jgi:uncharacterized membrane protein YkvA (DUF1232 family)